MCNLDLDRPIYFSKGAIKLWSGFAVGCESLLLKELDNWGLMKFSFSQKLILKKIRRWRHVIWGL